MDSIKLYSRGSIIMGIGGDYMRLIDADALDYELGIEDEDIYARAVISEAPTVDAVPVVHGRWIFHDDGSGTCNQCGIRQSAIWDYDNSQNFCGHCGAKMDGKEE